MYRNASKFAFRIALALLVMSQIGCFGQKRVEITGRVTYNGLPLQLGGGEIVFVGTKGTQVVAPIGPDGYYRALRVPTGLNQVAVYYRNPEIKLVGKQLSTPQMNGQASFALQAFLTPAKYASVDTSEMSVDVQKGVVFDADLTGSPLR